MTPLLRGTCIRCRKSVALRTGDIIREHKIAKLGGKFLCPGVAMRPLEELQNRPHTVTDNERRVADEGGAW